MCKKRSLAMSREHIDNDAADAEPKGSVKKNVCPSSSSHLGSSPLRWA